MAIKDRYDNNLRRGDRVKDMRADEKWQGEVVGSGQGSQVLVKWDDGEESLVEGRDVVSLKGRMR